MNRLQERQTRWTRYLGDLQTYATLPQPLETEGTLVRVTGLVLEAAGVRVPVGSVCEVRSPGQAPVLAEVVGFNGDRAFLMPTGELHGLASGARVLPRAAPNVPPRFGQENHPWRRSEDRGLHLPMGDGLLGRVVDAHGVPMDRGGPLATVARRTHGAPPDQRDGPRPGAPAAGHRRARDQRAAHGGPRPAPGPVCRHRRRQVGADGHDGALHRGRCHRRRHHVPAVVGAGRRVYGLAGRGQPGQPNAEASGAAQSIQALTGRKPADFRGATAVYDEDARRAIHAMGYRIAGFWSTPTQARRCRRGPLNSACARSGRATWSSPT